LADWKAGSFGQLFQLFACLPKRRKRIEARLTTSALAAGYSEAAFDRRTQRRPDPARTAAVLRDRALVGSEALQIAWDLKPAEGTILQSHCHFSDLPADRRINPGPFKNCARPPAPQRRGLEPERMRSSSARLA
jgi:hypothetical protein